MVALLSRRSRLCLLALLVGGTVACHYGNANTRMEEALAADEAVSRIRTWQDLRAWYDRFKAYDDGSMAEGVSSYVVHTLAAQWNTLLELAREVSRSKPFRDFVVKHIDTTTDYDDLRVIISNASSRCPEGETRLCKQLGQAASEALEEGLRVVPEGKSGAGS